MCNSVMFALARNGDSASCRLYAAGAADFRDEFSLMLNNYNAIYCLITSEGTPPRLILPFSS